MFIILAAITRLLSRALLVACAAISIAYAQENNGGLPGFFRQYCQPCEKLSREKSGLYILEKGEEALIARAWLVEQATTSIDVQYFIWSTDKIGRLATEYLLTAAERGVRVRVIVDDLLVEADNDSLIALSAHENIQVKAYNPKHRVGVSKTEQVANVVTDFRGVNQRMHDKTLIVDGLAGITGGRNMADEYFDYNQDYNFRDRDILVAGKVVADMTANFDEFWQSPLAVDMLSTLDPDGEISAKLDIEQRYQQLHQYAADPENFEPEVRDYFSRAYEIIPSLVSELIWDDAVFISDTPGKNDNSFFLDGGGESSSALFDLVAAAQQSIVIQSPYLILPEGLLEKFKELSERGVSIKISTNSLASTDNLPAFSGYKKQREALLEVGIGLYEFNPKPAIQQELIDRYPRLADNSPVFAIHAKSMVVDGRTIYIGTFNLDPRSANLNTEVGILVNNETLAERLTAAIEKDMLPENSWHTTAEFNPDGEASWWKRTKVFFYRLLPLEPVL